ncbi:hypothetical protein LTR10_019042 [Elasticomyces elasticus]|uniref:FAD-binding PCMH-type domain-containing protein n=1 Tax=Exophiala sideris TaxID=1016849 RepID=A0ABR0IYU4_9EURO|nr:hypothetical protein LTR10_019042 [Elasticomyces elasticus]KAK5022928.1 hypothetical protein LTS07_009656 [Exophiala sideris]KAK5026393.1 hypothetical protein LTR13_010007 [Exophiala sideris]KAK5052328.1 hypothetical protein LTR69_009864 [Exophiala sideris]KAK5177355.1 hypothetical protein LTR44_010150 [Eurotiomycetes sp. CCFEE 6388]
MKSRLHQWRQLANAVSRGASRSRRHASNASHSQHNSIPRVSRTTASLLSGATALAGGSLAWMFATQQQKPSRIPQHQHAISQNTGSLYADRETMLKAASLIAEALGEDSVSYDEDDIETHGYSTWSTSNTEVRPVAIVRPTCTEDVQQIAKICSEYKVPMVPFGAGSSVEGNFVAPYSGLSIDLSQMDQLIAVHEDDMDAVVQPGVNWVDFNNKIKHTGLFLPLDPSPTALVGGMVSTNCSGTNAVRYGTMKDWVVNLTVVLADGSVFKTRHRPRKTSAGYNLTSLFTGAEGTLGIITEITVKLAPIPETFTVATAPFPSVKAAATAATRMLRAGIPLAAVELMDGAQMKIINSSGGAGGRIWKEEPTLFLKFSGKQRSVEEDIVRAKAISSEYGAGKFDFAKTEEEKHSLWSARKEALWAMTAQRPEGYLTWSTDVAVPLSRMAELIDISQRESSALGLFSTVLGHVGDGNFHQAVMYDPKNPKHVRDVKRCVDEMVKRAVEMEGTVSGEHGIGLGKKECLLKELGPETINVMRTLKRSLDPHCLLNPGKVFD